MIGQGILPERWHPLADQLEPEKLAAFLATVKTAFARDAARMPDHAAFLARFCPAGEVHA
jgi:tryptophan halogenase